MAAHRAGGRKQSRRPRIPTVTELTGSAELADRIGPGVLALVLHEDAAVGLAGCWTQLVGGELAELLVIVGPEGGVAPGGAGGVHRARRPAGPARAGGAADVHRGRRRAGAAVGGSAAGSDTAIPLEKNNNQTNIKKHIT